MNYDEIQKAWQSQGGPPKLTISADVLLQEVQRSKTWFEAAVFWRDVQEVGAAFALAVFFLCFGIEVGLWAVLPLVPACLWVGCFLLADRWMQRKRRPLSTDPLRTCIETSLLQIDHQAWLLRNVLWWYLLPPGIGFGFFIGGVFWLVLSGPGPVPVWVSLFLGGYVLFASWFFWGVYRLNQRCVRKQLLPRRQELEALLASLERPD
jgi:hypothetical protein